MSFRLHSPPNVVDVVPCRLTAELELATQHEVESLLLIESERQPLADA